MERETGPTVRGVLFTTHGHASLYMILFFGLVFLSPIITSLRITVIYVAYTTTLD